jgi:hypothetical protein
MGRGIAEVVVECALGRGIAEVVVECSLDRGIAEVVVEGSLGNRVSLGGCVAKGMVAGAVAVKLLSGLGTDMGTVGD